jgi:hypothetical protein
MNDENPAENERTFGEQLLGMQGFSASRAKRYREELEKLLVHRITVAERWTTGFFAVFMCTTLVIGGVSMATAKEHPEYAGFDQSRLTIAANCAITGLVMGGWLLRVAIQGGYGRRLGDLMGVFIALLFCGGWGFAFINMAWDVGDATLRMKLFLGSGTLFLVMAGCIIVAAFQRLHRQTQEKLLRIEYHLAELTERTEGRSSP